MASDVVTRVSDAVMSNVGRAIVNKEDEVRLCLVTLLCEGHLLIEDVPGVGKTTLAAALARSIGGGFQRIQFTSDMLPSDILGVTVYQPACDCSRLPLWDRYSLSLLRLGGLLRLPRTH